MRHPRPRLAIGGEPVGPLLRLRGAGRASRAALALALAAAVVAAMAPSSRAQAEGEVDDTPGEQLGGYVAQSAGAPFSIRPVFPTLVSTGNSPFEVTGSRTNANVKSGGNAFARGSLLWPGDAAANLRPLLLQTDAPESFVSLLPDYPLVVEASQVEGREERSVPAGMTMRATARSDRALGESKLTDVVFPGMFEVASVASESSARVTDSEVSAASEVTLHGISVVDGLVRIEELRSRSEVSSRGSFAESSGRTDVVGMTIGGIAVSITEEGFRVDGGPSEASDAPGLGDRFPGASPEEQLRQILEEAGMRITLFESDGGASEGDADRVSTGLLLSFDVPHVEGSPIPPGSRVDLLLGTTSASTSATEPFTIHVVDDTVPPGPPPTGAPGGTPTPSTLGASGTPGGPAAPSGDSRLSTVPSRTGPSVSSAPSAPGGGAAATGQLERTSSDYRFGGVPMPLVLALLAAAALGARYLRRGIERLVGSGGR